MGSLYNGNSQITELKAGEFCSFINDKDVVMVMFYSPFGEASRFVEPHYTAAPGLTDRANAHYAAVNCHTEGDLCFKEKAFEMPEFRAYSRGMLIGTFDEIYTISAKRIAEFVEELPVPVMSSTPVMRKSKTH